MSQWLTAGNIKVREDVSEGLERAPSAFITTIKVNSADPGYTATALNGHRGTQTIPEAAAEAIRLARLPDDGPIDTYSDSKSIVPW
jgi:hypothetical protein